MWRAHSTVWRAAVAMAIIDVIIPCVPFYPPCGTCRSCARSGEACSALGLCCGRATPDGYAACTRSELPWASSVLVTWAAAWRPRSHAPASQSLNSTATQLPWLQAPPRALSSRLWAASRSCAAGPRLSWSRWRVRRPSGLSSSNLAGCSRSQRTARCSSMRAR